MILLKIKHSPPVPCLLAAHTFFHSPATFKSSFFPDEISLFCIFHTFTHSENVFLDSSGFPNYSHAPILFPAKFFKLATYNHGRVSTTPVHTLVP